MIERFSLAARFKIVVLLGLAPVALLTQLFVSQSLKDIHFAEQERIGVTYLEAAWPAHSLASLGEPAGSESAPAATIAAAARPPATPCPQRSVRRSASHAARQRAQ